MTTNEDNNIQKEISAPQSTELYIKIADTQWPIIYTPEYNIGFLGLEKLHPFDAGKWGKVYEFLKEAKLIQEKTIVKPKEATQADLLVVHTAQYLKDLKWSLNVAQITEVPPVALLPNFIVQRKVLRPFRYHTGGTILAGKLAMERGWAINIGGGFHHCHAEKGGGFCAYADITLSLKFLFERVEGVAKAMIIDLDAHQGNGHERDFMDDEKVYIMDVYNRGIYPQDGFAKRAIKRKVELQHYTEDNDYLELVERHLEGALNEFTPDVVVYNAGTDILEGDPLGNLSITAQGIIDRDHLVFSKVRSRCIPILMVTSGGYQKTTARIIADSILNLHKEKWIKCDGAEAFQKSNLKQPDKISSLPRSRSEGLLSRLRRTIIRSQSSQEVHDVHSSESSSLTSGPDDLGGFSSSLENSDSSWSSGNDSDIDSEPAPENTTDHKCQPARENTIVHKCKPAPENNSIN
ncbi:histone deacetylase 11-like isoform X2 [Mytilus galloprovincialis]|uniref:histone deacetylase 11-like isoform X2 n=1 Tax=Mytilus galloprovincialis TaxID=29158 RepID=UPI003F7C9DC2